MRHVEIILEDGTHLDEVIANWKTELRDEFGTRAAQGSVIQVVVSVKHIEITNPAGLMPLSILEPLVYDEAP